MARKRATAANDLEQLIETKILEILGDPDYGLELKKDFKDKLSERLTRPGQTVRHGEVLKRLG